MSSYNRDTTCEHSDKAFDVSLNKSPLFSPECTGLLFSDSERLFSRGFWGADFSQVAPSPDSLNSRSNPVRFTGNNQTFPQKCHKQHALTKNISNADCPMNYNYGESTRARAYGHGVALRPTYPILSTHESTCVNLATCAVALKPTVDPKQINIPSPTLESPVMLLSTKHPQSDIWLALSEKRHQRSRSLAAFGQEWEVKSPLNDRKLNWDTDAGMSSLLDCSSPMSWLGDMTSPCSAPSHLIKYLPSAWVEYPLETSPVASREIVVPQQQSSMHPVLAAFERIRLATMDSNAFNQPRTSLISEITEISATYPSNNIPGCGSYDLDVDRLLNCSLDDITDLEHDYVDESGPRLASGVVPVLRTSRKDAETGRGIVKAIPADAESNAVIVPSRGGKVTKRANKSPRNKSRSAIVNTVDFTLFDCPQCDVKFRRQEHLKRHMRLVHSNIRPHKCLQCDKKFLRSDNLSQHTKTHDKQNVA